MNVQLRDLVQTLRRNTCGLVHTTYAQRTDKIYARSPATPSCLVAAVAEAAAA
jgi:hypothetical protein